MKLPPSLLVFLKQLKIAISFGKFLTKRRVVIYSTQPYLYSLKNNMLFYFRAKFQGCTFKMNEKVHVKSYSSKISTIYKQHSSKLKATVYENKRCLKHGKLVATSKQQACIRV